jgi:hypothetical protein
MRPRHAQAGCVDQVVRRQLFEAAHPDIQICYPGAARPWEGVITLPDGGAKTVTASELRHLLDRLETLTATRGVR